MQDRRDPRIVEFEAQLDAELAGLLTVRRGGEQALELAANLIEVAWAKQDSQLATRLTTGLHVLAPYLVGSDDEATIEPAALLADLVFAAHYYVLRDMLYYSYNAEGAMSWEFTPDRVEVRFADASLPRDFYLSYNNWFLDSMQAFKDHDDVSSRIEILLNGVSAFEDSPAVQEAAGLIEREVDIKLAIYFDLIDDRSVSAGQYTFGQFCDIYRALITMALYHRYHTRANDAVGVVTLPLDDLVTNLAEELDAVTEETARAVIEDISYGELARKARINPVYFSLFRVSMPDRVLMLPHNFATWEGFVSFLRLLAIRDPKTFTSSFSNQVGDGMVHRLADSASAAGFDVRTNLRLSGYEAALPDIDLLIISEEPSLGYALLFCEVKAPIPSRWAKDRLRALEPDSVVKAFGQLERIMAFLDTDTGIDFVRSLIPPGGLAHFDEFAVIGRQLVITSDNAGAFFADRGVTVIDYRTMERMLSRCDGDMHYVLHVLSHLDEWADSKYDRAMTDVPIGGRTVSYEGVVMRALLDLAPTTWKSENIGQAMADEMLRLGQRPLDVFREDPEKHSNVRWIDTP